ncbi:MAG: signal recognition particle-docking protein FtsY [Coriobacteriaceae bacterium]|nr:signal recognition particle-docking protein FtsY [Coriobacteriaceae bacterium]
MSWLERLGEGLQRTRERFTEQINVIFERGPQLDEDFWDDLEETLILSDFGAPASVAIIEQLRETAMRLALPDGYAVLDRMAETIADRFTTLEDDFFELNPVCVLFVGINGSGKTTTVGKIAKSGADSGRKVLLGSADTFRAAAIEQLDIWAQRAQVPVIKRQRGADPASISFEVIERAEEQGANLLLIDTAGRLHTSDDLMRELEKVVQVTRKRAERWQRDGAPLPVKTVLTLDATTGQNGLQQAREFNRALALDGVIITKMDGTAKGGIAVAVSHELGLPIVRVGVGEGIDDLKAFDPLEFAKALIGRS